MDCDGEFTVENGLQFWTGMHLQRIACESGSQVNVVLTRRGLSRTREYRGLAMRHLRADRRRAARFPGLYDELQTWAKRRDRVVRRIEADNLRKRGVSPVRVRHRTVLLYITGRTDLQG